MRKRVPLGEQPWLPALLVATVLTTVAMLAMVMHISDAPAFTITMAQAIAFRAAVLWALSFAFFLAANLWTWAAAWSIVRTRWPRAGSLLTLSAAVLVGVLSIRNWCTPGLLAYVTAHTGIPVRAVTLIGNVVGAACGVMIVTACVALAIAPSDLTIINVRRKIERARILLFSTAALLATGSAETYLVLRWPTALSPANSAQQAVFQYSADTIAVTAAVSYTAILLLLFMPIAARHEAWVERLWEERSPDVPRKQWLADNGLDRSVVGVIAQALTVAGPALITIVKVLVG